MRCEAKSLLLRAYGNWAVGAFNVCNLEQIHGAFRGAALAQAPIIIQFTRVMRDYAHPLMLEYLVRGAEEIYPEVVFAIHHDHGDETSCADAVASGHYSSVMIDGSELSFEENVALTRRVVDQAHARGTAVEAELGQLTGVEDSDEAATAPRAKASTATRKRKLQGPSQEESVGLKSPISQRLTDPSEAEEFVKRTGCDSLAVAVGTSHGAYKFAGRQRLRLETLREIQRHLPGVPLVLHGASAVSKQEISRIRDSGGRMEESAGGLSESDLNSAIRLGVAKINIATDGRLLWTRVHREFFRDEPGEFDFMKPGRVYMDAFAELVAAKCRALGAQGKAGA